MAKNHRLQYIFQMNKKIRYSGVLLHPTSLPGRHGIGDLGDEAKRFIDFLSRSHIGLWQILPLGPVGFGNSPYAARSAFAGNELLINLDQLAVEGYLDIEEVLQSPRFPERSVDFPLVESYKRPLLAKAAGRFLANAVDTERTGYDRFCGEQSDWLDDYALYMALCDHFGDSRWFGVWDRDLTKRNPKALEVWRERKRDEIAVWKVLQYFFHKQWQAVRTYAREHGVSIVGDIPIFVAADSVDAWSNRRYLKIDEHGAMTAQSGVPPDAFSATGQLWGNPVYDWEALESDGFSWWIRRMERLFCLADVVRIDHFRGFEAYWEVPAGETTAERGAWVKAPGEALFTCLRDHFGILPLFAEDLGVITEPVERLRDSNGFPGMKVAHFAFDLDGQGELDAGNAYLPHNYTVSCVAYTGTHDNNTTKGWYDSLDESHKDIVRRYLSCSDHEVVWHLMRAIMASSARYAIVPMQDLLETGSEGRMNTPGTCGPPNWCWRMGAEDLSDDVVSRTLSLVKPFGRTAGAEDLRKAIASGRCVGDV